MSSIELSIVATGRNDGYGGDFIGRSLMFLESVARLAARSHMEVEVLLVEWNPPVRMPSWSEALITRRRRMRRVLPGLSVRFLTVPPAIHRVQPGASDVPIFEYRAKNVGIRRARGSFVLATNPDVLFSSGIARYLCSGPLAPSSYYRTDRVDVSPPRCVLTGRMTEWWARRHVVAIHPMAGSKHFDRPVGHHTALRQLADQSATGSGAPDSKKARATASDPLASLHTNASGDFMLMARAAWHLLGGYPECFVSPHHVDSYMVVMAAASGLSQSVLPREAPLFHLEHPRAIDPRNPASATRPVNSYEDFRRDALSILEGHRSPRFNDESWGLAENDLEERMVVW